MGALTLENFYWNINQNILAEPRLRAMNWRNKYRAFWPEKVPDY
jgi:hypothetical protein